MKVQFNLDQAQKICRLFEKTYYEERYKKVMPILYQDYGPEFAQKAFLVMAVEYLSRARKSGRCGFWSEIPSFTGSTREELHDRYVEFLQVASSAQEIFYLAPAGCECTVMGSMELLLQDKDLVLLTIVCGLRYRFELYPYTLSDKKALQLEEKVTSYYKEKIEPGWPDKFYYRLA